MKATKESLLKPRLSERDVELEGVGTVRVRSMTRGEYLRFNEGEITSEEMDVLVLTACLVDPALSEDEVRGLMEAGAPKELAPIVNAILELSGLRKEATKEAVKTFPE